MKVSLNWVKEFTAVDLPVDKLVEKIGAQLGAVEGVIDLGKKYEGILVVKVVACEKHPNADKLSLCLVDDGDTNKKVKRNKDGLIEVVCGAPNVKAGQLAVWIPPGATVPSSPESEPFVIEAREIRGKLSNGMLASAKELAIGDSHEGILVLAHEVDSQQSTVGSPKSGMSLAEVLWLDDYIIDIENKMFTHRPDCFGQLGIARELAGIQGQPFKSPDWYREDAKLDTDGRKNVLKLAVKNDVPKLVPRFCAVAIKDIKVGPSPAWLQVRLSSVGIRPINNIVDVTNFYMMETGQPLHAYDYDKLKTGTLGARLSKKGDELRIIGGKTIKLEHEAVVITDGNKPVGLGGVMGGADTEVDNDTKSIVLEAATFDMNATRRAAMAYGLFTDAATRFTKGQSPWQNMAVLAKAVEDIKRVAGGRQASKIIDDFESSVVSRQSSVKTTTAFINGRLGLDLATAEIKKLLENVEFKVNANANSLNITVPFWRTDIEIPEDIVEEVGRLYGYDKLPLTLPPRDLAPAARDQLLDFKARLRDILRAAGANEVLTYSFVHGNLLKKVGQDPTRAYQLSNALSPDLQYYRLSLTPSLLEKIHPNVRAGFKDFVLFEIGKGHNQMMKADEKLPKEFQMLSVVCASTEKTAKTNGAPFYQARAILNYLAHELGLKLEFRVIPKEEPYSVAKPYEHTRSAQVWDRKTATPLGMIGEYKQSVINNLKLPSYSAGFDLDVEGLLKTAAPHSEYWTLNRFPEIEQDFCLRSSVSLNHAQLTTFVLKNLADLADKQGYTHWLRTLDIYRRENDNTHKQTTWRIILSHPERTLTTQETNNLLDELAARAKEKLNAERI